MMAEPLLQTLSEPVPQVGAVLCFDSEISSPDFRGSKHWKLAGSCVLVTRDRCLTIGHILGGRTETPAAVRRRYALFFPYEGFFELSQEPLEWEEDQTPGDNLALVRLGRPVEHWDPLPPRKIPSRYKYTGRALVCGYGCWPESPFGSVEGLQQQHLVNLGPPPRDIRRRTDVRGWGHYDNLDLSWSSRDNDDKTAGRGNSGGPFLWGYNGPRFVVGITREAKNDQQAGSWIGWDRTRWLYNELNGHALATGQRIAPLSSAWRSLKIGTERGEVVPFKVPPGATRVQATLNASQGVRLQMDIVPAAQDDGFLDRLKLIDEASGQFLYRSFELPEGLEEIVIGVSPVANTRADAENVFAQLCVLFV